MKQFNNKQTLTYGLFTSEFRFEPAYIILEFEFKQTFILSHFFLKLLIIIFKKR